MAQQLPPQTAASGVADFLLQRNVRMRGQIREAYAALRTEMRKPGFNKLLADLKLHLETSRMDDATTKFMGEIAADCAKLSEADYANRARLQRKREEDMDPEEVLELCKLHFRVECDVLEGLESPTRAEYISAPNIGPDSVNVYAGPRLKPEVISVHDDNSGMPDMQMNESNN